MAEAFCISVFGQGRIPVTDQQPGTGPILHGALGGLNAGHAKIPRHGAGVGSAAAQKIQRGADGIAVCAGQVREHQPRHGNTFPILFRQPVTHGVRSPFLPQYNIKYYTIWQGRV